MQSLLEFAILNVENPYKQSFADYLKSKILSGNLNEDYESTPIT